MTRLAKLAAVATIIGTIFTIYIYYNDGKTIPIVSGMKDSSEDDGSNQSDKNADRENVYCELLIQTSLFLVLIRSFFWTVDYFNGRDNGVRSPHLTFIPVPAMFTSIFPR
jgi:hypothetical protein